MRPALPAHRPELVSLLAEQNTSPSKTAGNGAAAEAIAALRGGAGVVVTGQQVGLFGGPLFTPFKAATAVARARQATSCGSPHVAVFWLATEDHDFAEIDHVVFPARRELRKLSYSPGAETSEAARPVGAIVLDDTITALINEAREVLGASEATEALAAAYRPGRTFAEAFGEFYSRAFAEQGLLVLDASSRAAHRMGARVLRAAIERADELHSALLDRDRELEIAGYHAQVAVTTQSSLLFAIDKEHGARLALKRQPPSAAEPDGLWQAGRQRYSTGELLGMLEAEPERISPSALLRPVFQDFLLSTSTAVGGPAEIAYFAQSAVLYERILGRTTPAIPRFSGTLIEPAIGELMRKHELSLEQVFEVSGTEGALAQMLAARSMPMEGRTKLAATGAVLDAELTPLVDWMRSLDTGLGQSAETAAGKIRYQMDRLRHLAANFQLQREASLARQAETISHALYPGGGLQERMHGAAYYFARYGFELAETLVAQASNPEPGHVEIWL